MGRILLAVDGSVDSRAWLKEQADSMDVLDLNLDDPLFGLPTCCTLTSGGKSPHRRFVGSLYAQRDPIRTLQAGFELCRFTKEDAVLRLFTMRGTPLHRSMALAVADGFQPDHVLCGGADWLRAIGWLSDVEPIILPEGADRELHASKRRAAWVDLLDRSDEHDVEIRDIRIIGTRLGSGVRVETAATYAERCGQVLLMVTDEEMDEHEVTAALAEHRCDRAHFVSPSAYEGLVCAFFGGDGEELGVGRIESIDFEKLVVHARCSAVAPAPVRTLHIGSLRISADGRESGEVKPWAV